jgi:hypothetical protein
VAKVEQRRKAGHLHTTVLSSVRDDVDDRAEEEKRAAKTDDQNKRTESPFAGRNQAKYTFTTLGPDPKEPALLRIGFGPLADPSSEVMQGEALVDPEAGELVQLTFRPSKYPTFVDALQMHLEYRLVPGAGRLVSRFTFTGSGGLLMFKKHGDADVAFTYPEEAK